MIYKNYLVLMIKKKNIFNKHWSGIRAVVVAPTFAFNSTNRAIEFNYGPYEILYQKMLKEFCTS
jgi:hypothetical protein